MTTVYIIKFLYSVFLLPPGLFIAALLLLAWRCRRNRVLARGALVVAAVLYLGSVGLVSGPLIHSLETRYTPPAQVGGDVIVVLGSGATLDTPNLGGKGHLSGAAANRLLTGLQLYHKLGVPIIFSGGQVFATGGVEAEVARSILLSAGVPADKIIAETASLNTGENARNTAAILAQRGFARPILVTSACHMERSVLQFRKAGIDVVPFPTDYQENIARGFRFIDLWPLAAATEQLAVAPQGIHRHRRHPLVLNHGRAEVPRCVVVPPCVCSRTNRVRGRALAPSMARPALGPSGAVVAARPAEPPSIWALLRGLSRYRSRPRTALHLGPSRQPQVTE